MSDELSSSFTGDSFHINSLPVCCLASVDEAILVHGKYYKIPLFAGDLKNQIQISVKFHLLTIYYHLTIFICLSWVDVLWVCWLQRYLVQYTNIKEQTS
jgi:hypothetical protein